jgi:hypothetical protein
MWTLTNRRGVTAWAIAFSSGLLASGSALAQGIWQPVPQVPAEIEKLPAFVRSDVGSVVRIDWPQLEKALAALPVEGGELGAIVALEQQPTLDFPLPDGTTTTVRIVNSPIMEAGLAAQFPQFQTYRVTGVDDPTLTGRLDITSLGLRAQLRTAAGQVFVDPYSARQREYASVYYLHEYAAGRPAPDFVCHVGPEHGAGPADAAALDAAAGPSDALAGGAGGGGGGTFQPRGGLTLRTYRLGMACTGEFGAFISGVNGNPPNATDALAAIVTVTNRVNVTFEADLGVRFVLIANNNLLAFFDPATDPYPNADPACTTNPAADCSGPYLSANQTALTTIIGSANYDVGHLLTRVRGGVANLRSVCSSGSKARGISGIPRGGELDPVSGWVPMHELGHQFGANHTFNGVLGRCNSNINGTTNWEPGGGSTIMAYPGACPVGGPYGDGTNDNLVQYGDTYFNVGSLLEMRSFLASVNSGCSISIPSGNAGAPLITSITPADVYVPPATPFVLTLTASDASPTLTYTWEQQDIGPAQTLAPPGNIDNGSSALFRSWPPAGDARRIFPRMSDLLAGVPYAGERLPTVAPAIRKFRATIRDNQGASTISGLVNVNVTPSEPFMLTNPACSLRLGVPTLVTWTVGSTNSTPINVNQVRIMLSLDNGVTFPTTLATVPNTGSWSYTPSGLPVGATARVRIDAVNGVFFAVSSALGVTTPCDSLDFNRDGFSPDSADLDDFLAVLGGGPGACSNSPNCGDIDFNNDCLSPDVLDLDAFLVRLSGGPCE